MIEIDWDKIRENTLKLVCGYRDTYAGKEWKCRELQEKNGQIRTEIERIFKYIQSSNSELSWFQGKVSDDILSNYIAGVSVSSDRTSFSMEYRRIIMQMNYYENLWIELPDGIQKMTEDEKKLFLSTDVIRFCMDR